MNILYLYMGNVEREKLQIVRMLDAQGYYIEDLGFGWGSKFRIGINFIFKFKYFLSCDAVISTDYNLSFYANLILLLTRRKVKHITIGMNQSNRLWKTKNKVLDSVIDKIFNRNDFIIFYSQKEIQLFSDNHNLKRPKSAFCHWGFDLPAFDRNNDMKLDFPYFCMIGRNNRDFFTFCMAIKEIDVKGIIIASEYVKLDFDLPDNIIVFRNLSFQNCLQVINKSIANVILLNDGARGAGHITIVSSMLLKKSQIITDIDVIKDYFIDQQHGWLVKVKDIASVRRAMLEAIVDIEERGKKELNSFQYAEKWLTSGYSNTRIIQLLLSYLNGQEYDDVDKAWLLAYNSLIRKGVE